jgi:imidazolonepropionase-like amidohydrolase
MTLVLRVGSLVDGLGGDPITDAVVVLDGGAITACGPRDAVSVPEGAEVLEAPRHTLMPGLIDCHVHMMAHSLRLEDRLMTHPTLALFMAARHLDLTLRAGFTTVRDAGGADPGLRQAVDRGLIPGPRLLVAAAVGQTGTHLESYFPTGVKLNIGGNTAARICDGPDQARRVVREAMREGFDVIKICTTGGALSPQDSPYFTELTLEEIRAIVETAASYGRTVMAHAQGTQGIKNAISGGVWSVEHGSIQDQEATRMLVDTGTYLIPTLMVAHWVLDHGREAGVPEASLQKGAELHSFHFDSIRRAVQAGVKIAVGTDALGAMHGSNAKELELLVTEAGLTPMQAIVAATKTGAEVCRLGDRVGTIEVGKLADLVLVDGDPLDDICILQDRERLTVFKEGTLVAVGPNLRDRARG